MLLKKIMSFVLIVIIVAVISSLYLLNGSYTRMLLFFDHAHSGQEMTEVRYLKTRVKPLAEHIVDELLLGPVNHDFSLIFVGAPRVNRCFVDGNSLYIDIPQSGFNVDGSQKGSLPKRSFELVKKSIFKNCPEINAIYFYLDGQRIFEYLPAERAQKLN